MAALGIPCVVQNERKRSYGTLNRPWDDGHTYLTIYECSGRTVSTDSRHWCLRAPSRTAVDAFYAAGIAAKGQCDGPPGLRPHYHAAYYAAFLLDPDGNRVEAVYHRET